MNVRLLVVHNETDEISVIWRPVALPCQLDSGTTGAVGLKLQNRAFTWGETQTKTCQSVSFREANVNTSTSTISP